MLCSNSRVVIGQEPNDNIHSLSAPHKDGAISAPLVMIAYEVSEDFPSSKAWFWYTLPVLPGILFPYEKFNRSGRQQRPSISIEVTGNKPAKSNRV